MLEMLATFYSLLERPPRKIGISTVFAIVRARLPLFPFPAKASAHVSYRSSSILPSRCYRFLQHREIHTHPLAVSGLVSVAAIGLPRVDSLTK